MHKYYARTSVDLQFRIGRGKMNSLAIALLSATLCAFVAGQNLVLLGGNLRGDNIQLWNKMVDLAVGFALLVYAYSLEFLETNEDIIRELHNYWFTFVIN